MPDLDTAWSGSLTAQRMQRADLPCQFHGGQLRFGSTSANTFIKIILRREE